MFLRQLLSGSRPRGPVRRATHRRQPRRPLRFEAMEARRLLAVYIVDTFDDGLGSCGDGGVQNANCTLRSAIIAANNNPGADEIRLAPGTYTRDELLGPLDVTDSLTIIGLGAGPEDVIIDAGGMSSGFVVSALGTPITVRFENLTVQNGFDLEEGAGIFAGEQTRVEVINSIIQDNVVSDPQFAFAGGGIFAEGSLLIEDSILRRNRAEGGVGGGVAFLGSSGSELIIRNTLFEGNSSDEGGGLNATGSFGGDVLLENVTFSDNVARFAGGGAYIYLVGDAEVIDSRFSGNQAGEAGGGLYLLDNGSSRVARSTFDGNTVEGTGSEPGGGGGLTILTDAVVEDSLFQNNQVLGTRPFAGDLAFDEGGGGIAIAQDFGFQPTVTIVRSSILNNRAPLAGGIGAANAHVTLRAVTVRDNEAFGSLGGAGGIGFAQEPLGVGIDPVRLQIFDSTIAENTSLVDAGGIGVADAAAEIVNTSIVENSAGSRAGGLGIISVINPASVRLEASTVAFNTAGDIGGGIGAIDAGLELLNVTVSDNRSGAAGGGIAFINTDDAAVGSVSFSTIASNTSAEPGSNVASGALPLVFTGTLLADPQSSTPLSPLNAAAAPGGVISQGFNLDSDGSAGFDQASDLVGVDPLLGPLADNGGPVMTRELLPGSPAIDAGGTSPPTVDARGLPRPIDGTGDGVALNDIGAFEVQQFTPVLVSLGDLVFFDVNNTGFFDPQFDSGIAGVTLTLFRDENLSGGLDPTDPLVASTTTDANGNYLFSGLTAGDYIVRVDLSNFDPGGPLVDRVPSTANQPAPDPNNNVDGDNNGFYVPGVGVLSLPIRLAPGTEPDPGGGPPVSNVNLTLDFGFVDNTLAAVDDEVETTQDIPAVIDVLANDFDTAGSTLFVASVAQPANGTAEIVGNQIRYVPAPGFTGGDTFGYTIVNEFEQQASALVTVDVTPVVNEADLAVSVTAEPRGIVERGGLIDVTITASNLSTAAATGVVVAAELSEGLAFVSGEAGQGSLLEQDGVITVSGFSLAGGESVSVTLVVQVRSTADLPIEEFVTSEISADQPDPDTDNNFDSVDIFTASALHTLTTGTDEGSVTLQVDAFGGFGTARFFESSIADYNPVGPIPPASAIFQSYVAARTDTSGPRTILQQGSGLDILMTIAGSETAATSRFGVGPLVVELTQTVEPTLDADGNRLGSRLVQSYQVTNTATSGPATFLDLVRYVDADLFFDGTLIDGGGLLMDASGELILFTTDSGGTGATDTTFVGISASGGTVPSVGRFELDDFFLLEDRVLDGDPLRDQVAGDTDGSGFINPGEEYDVAMALRNLLTLAPGESLTYETVTIFGTRPETVVPPPPAGDLAGRVVCTDEVGVAQGVAGVTVFIDLNGNRRLDTAGPNPEPFTVTDAQGNYLFSGLDLPAGSTANVIAQNPPACIPAAAEIGVTRVAIPTGSLSRAIATLDFNLNEQSDLVVANDLSNDVVVLLNDGGEFSVGPTFALGHRPHDVAVWQPEGAPATIAVAAIGTPADRGFLYVIENGNVQQFTSGDGPISVVADDFNGDGQVDFVTASFRSGTVVGRMSGDTEERVLVSAEVPRAVVSGSLRGNDVRDLVVVSSGFASEDGFEVIVLLNDGNANFTTHRERISGAGGVDVSLADVTGDGRDEIIVAGFDGLIRIYGFDPANSAIELIETLSLSRGVQAVVARDLNDDGFVDLVVANARNETIELFMGSPDGFMPNRTITGVPTPGALTVSEVDEGRLYVAVANLLGTGTPARLPSTATILELTVAEQEIELRPGEVNRVDFGFRLRPVGRSERTPESFNFDVNRDGEVTALDALVILNTVADTGRAEGEQAKARRERFKTDVNGDGLTTPLDALLVLNRLAQEQRTAAEAESPLAAASAVGTPPANDSEDDRRRREQAADAVFGDSLLF